MMKNKTITWIGVRLLIATVLYACVYTGFNAHLSGAIKAEMTALTALDIALTPGELLKHDLTGKDGGPLWRSAADLWKSGEEERKDFPMTLLNCRLTRDTLLKPDEEEPVNQEELEAIRQMVGKNGRILQLLREAADCPNYKTDLDYLMGPDTPLPHLKPAKDMAGLVNAAAALAILDKKPKEAIEHWRSLQGLARWHEHELTLLSKILGEVIKGIFFESIQDALTAMPFTDEDLASVKQMAQAPINPKAQNRQGINAEMVFFGLNIMNAFLTGEETPWRPRSFAMHGVCRLWIKWEMLTYLRIHRTYFAQLDDFYDKPWAPQGTEEKEPSVLAPINSMIVINFQSISKRFIKNLVQQNLTCCLVHIYLHKNRTGSFPDSLDQLAFDKPEEKKHRLDWYSGKDLCYEKKGNGFVLYSIGENKTDDSDGKGDMTITVQ